MTGFADLFRRATATNAASEGIGPFPHQVASAEGRELQGIPHVSTGRGRTPPATHGWFLQRRPVPNTQIAAVHMYTHVINGSLDGYDAPDPTRVCTLARRSHAANRRAS